MKCVICGKEFPANTNARRKPKYCSAACKQKAYELRKRIGAKPEVKREKRKVTVQVSKNVDAELDKDTFERMRDGALVDTLRFNRDVLQKALGSPDTPPSALAAISKQLIDVCRQIETLETDDGDVLASSEELTDDAILADII
jgi:hypothetical protein